MNPLHNELKKELQIERIILFSDAVFAIAITLLVIEIKVPEIEKNHLSEKALAEALIHLIPKFFGFIVSFMLIGIYWTVHHRLFGYVIGYTPKLLRLNLLFLFTIALMPFSTAFYSEYALQRALIPAVFYTGNVVLLGIFNLLMWRYIGNPKNKLNEGLLPFEAKFYSLRAIVVPIVFTVFVFVYLVQPYVASFIPMLIPLIMRIITKRFKKKKEKLQLKVETKNE